MIPEWQPTMRLRWRTEVKEDYGTFRILYVMESEIIFRGMILEQLWTREEWTEWTRNIIGENIVPPLYHSRAEEWRQISVAE